MKNNSLESFHQKEYSNSKRPTKKLNKESCFKIEEFVAPSSHFWQFNHDL